MRKTEPSMFDTKTFLERLGWIIEMGWRRGRRTDHPKYYAQGP